jgi:hypothetical protein
MILRPYQAVASAAIFKEWQENNATLVVMPTGGGKTILFADVIRRLIDYCRTGRVHEGAGRLAGVGGMDGVALENQPRSSPSP